MSGSNEYFSASSLIADVSKHINFRNLEMKDTLHECATIIQEAAKEKLGHYQGASGKFASWKKLAESTKNERELLGYTRNDPLLRSGELRDSIEVESHATKAYIGVKSRPSTDEKEDIGDIAVWMEGGTASVPPRSFLGPALYENADRVAHEISHQAFRSMRGAIRG